MKIDKLGKELSLLAMHAFGIPTIVFIVTEQWLLVAGLAPFTALFFGLACLTELEE